MTEWPKARRALDTPARWLAVSGTLAAPWLFGATDAWVYLALSLWIGIGALLWLIGQAAYGRLRDLACPPAAILLFALGLFVMLQALPLPWEWVERLAPLQGRLWRDAQVAASAILGRPPLDTAPSLGEAPALSVSPAATWDSLWLFLTYAAVFVIAGETIREWRPLRRLAVLLVCSGFVMAVIALVHRFSGSREIFWFRAPRHGGDVFGPFSNRNHFAAHMNLLFGVALGLFLSSRLVRETMAWTNWRDRLAWLSTRNAGRIVLSGFALVLMAGAVCASLSRGAMVGLAAAILFFAALAALRWRRAGGLGVTAALAGLAVAAAALWLGGLRLAGRLGTLTDLARNPLEDFRLIVSLDTLRLFRTSPWFGCGFGAFHHAFPMFQSPGLQFRWLHAHNDWAQLFAEGGLVGAGLFLAALGFWLRAVLRGMDKAPRVAQLMTWGLLTGLTALAIHSVADYSLHKPANALFMSLLAGLALAAARLQGFPTPSASKPKPDSPAGRVLYRLVAIAMAAVVAVSLLVNARALRGELALARLFYWQKAEAKSPPPAAAQALTMALTEAETIRAAGNRNADGLTDAAALFLNWGLREDLDRRLRIRLAETSVVLAWDAVRAAPSDYTAWLWLARGLMAFSQVDAADTALERARTLASHPGEVRLFLPPERPPDPE